MIGPIEENDSCKSVPFRMKDCRRTNTEAVPIRQDSTLQLKIEYLCTLMIKEVSHVEYSLVQFH